MPCVLVLFLGQESGVEVLDHPEPSHPLVNIWHCFRGLRAITPDSKKELWAAVKSMVRQGTLESHRSYPSLELSGLQQKTPAEPAPSCTMIFSLLPVITGQRLLTV